MTMRDLGLHVLDLARNAAEAGASRIDVRVDEDPSADRVSMAVADDGRGMDAAAVERASDPFARPRALRGAGLGLALLRQAAEAAGGTLTIASLPGRGTTVTAAFRLTHVDRAPLGDLASTALVLLASHPDLEVTWTHRRGAADYSLSSADVRAALDGAAPSSAAALALARRAVRLGEAGLGPTHPSLTGSASHA